MTIHRKRLAAAFFDAVGTLFHLRAPVGEIYLERARCHGLESSDPDLARKLTESFRRGFRSQGPLAFPNQPADRIPALEREWWKAVVTATFGPFHRPLAFEAFFEDLYNMFRTSEGWRLDPDAGRVLEVLRGRGMKIGLVTNYDSRVLDVLESLGIRSLFDEVTISTLAGAAKPDPLIFLKTCTALSCLPAQTVHVGDDYEEDLRGASQAGLNAFLYDPGGRYRDQNLPRICKLAELLEILL
jgi:putative hydrolase of the HAD superfamily